MNTNVSPEQSAATKRGVISWAIKGLFAKALVVVVLFWSAGDLRWLWGWVYVAIFLAFDLATALVVIPRHPELLVERSRKQPDTKRWDSILVQFAAFFLPVATWIVAGLGWRSGWLPGVALELQVAAAIITMLGYGIDIWAMGANAFFSVTVRIQKERGHTVATGGPYRFVRHPGYVGAMIFTIAAPIMLGSVWALIPAGINVILYIVRTALEDKTLLEELEGYPEYARQTRYRLLPGIW